MSDLRGLDSLLVGFNQSNCDPSLLLRALYWQSSTATTPAQPDATEEGDGTVNHLCPKLADIELQF